MADFLQVAIFIAGLGQLVLAAASAFIPRQLGWREKLGGVDPLLRRIFWVYAAYILGTNVALGLVSTFASGALVEGGSLAFAVNVYAAVYWGARLVIQLVWFRGLAPEGLKFRVAETALVLLFVFLSSTYVVAAARTAIEVPV
ncbi:MAG: hypothetical protein ACE5KM_15335 [Planctomycetaceae bacterium]